MMIMKSLAVMILRIICDDDGEDDDDDDDDHHPEEGLLGKALVFLYS